MITHDLVQGSPDWLAYRAQHFNASDAPAMMGCSAYKTRTQLLHELHTGMTPEVDAATQRRFDDGHRFEALARPVAEAIIGMELYPVTGSEGKLSASFDGLDMAETVAFEHKTLNDELRVALQSEDNANLLPLQYRVQMEQQLMVSGADKVLFMASKWQGDELVEERHCWYACDPELRGEILQGWTQFAIDLEAYVPAEVIQAAVAAPVIALPAVFIQVEGSIALIDNLDVFGKALTAYIERINKEPETDQDFADLEATVKALKKAEDALDAAENGALAQTESIDSMRRTVGLYRETARTNRLLVEKLVKVEKENRRTKIISDAVAELHTHISALQTRLGKPYLPTIQSNFPGVVKGLKSIDSTQDKVDTELARCKIEANSIADKIQINLGTLRELAKDHAFLFTDTAQIVLKAPDDLTALVKTRISDFKESEEKRLEAEREKIRAEEVAKLAKEQADKDALAECLATAEQRERERQAEMAGAVLQQRAMQAEAKPEPVIATVLTAVIGTDTVAHIMPAKLITAIPAQTSTRADIIAILDTLNESDLVRTLHFVQTRFTQVAA